MSSICSIYIYNSKSLDVVQSLCFVSLYLYVPDEGSLLPKYRDCTTSNDFELYLMCCGVMLLLLIIYIYSIYVVYVPSSSKILLSVSSMYITVQAFRQSYYN